MSWKLARRPRCGQRCAAQSRAAWAVATRGGAPAIVPEIAGDRVVEPRDPALRRALDQALAEPTTGSRRWTQAVVIVHDGQAIGALVHDVIAALHAP
jgi:hypothetical protein